MAKQVIWREKSVSLALFAGLLTTISGLRAVASSFDPSPIYPEAMSYMTAIPTTGSLTGLDQADIYFPVTENPTATFPIALMLQGALVVCQF